MKCLSNATSKLITGISALAIFVLLCGPTALAGPPWDQTWKLLASDGSGLYYFGNSVSISDNLALIGASNGRDPNGINTGSAYVIDTTTGRQIFKLLAADGTYNNEFGSAVALSKDIGIVGAWVNTNDNGRSAGAAYVFDMKSGQQLYKLLANDGASNDQFGNAVAVSGHLAVIGARFKHINGITVGAAYVFDVSTGQQLYRLLASDGGSSDEFGESVAISGNLAVIGAPFHDDRGKYSGAAYVFDMTTGKQIFKLLASDGEPEDYFGSSVAISGNSIVVGAWKDDTVRSIDSGSMYLFDASTGEQLRKFLPSDGAERDAFGFSVAISGNLAVAGAWGDDNENGLDAGSAYVFDVKTGRQLYKILADNGAVGDVFGSAVSISQNRTVCGATGVDDDGEDSGAAYFFQRGISALSVEPDPLLSRQDGAFFIVDGLPNERIWIIYSLSGLKQTFIRKLNVVIDLANPRVAIGPRRTDSDGDLEVTLPMPGISRPIKVWFQAVQPQNVTNFVPTRIVP